jgi:hypothetical protein
VLPLLSPTAVQEKGSSWTQTQVTSGPEECCPKYKTGRSKTLNKVELCLRDPARNSCHSEDAGTFPQVPVRTRLSAAPGPLCANLAHALQESRRTNCRFGKAPTRIYLYFRTLSRLETQKFRCTLKTALSKVMYALSQGRVVGRHKASTSYFSPTRSRQGFAGSENGRAKRHRQEAGTGPRPEWKDIADRSPTHKSYWAQWKSLALRIGVPERNWESANEGFKLVQK